MAISATLVVDSEVPGSLVQFETSNLSIELANTGDQEFWVVDIVGEHVGHYPVIDFASQAFAVQWDPTEVSTWISECEPGTGRVIIRPTAEPRLTNGETLSILLPMTPFNTGEFNTLWTVRTVTEGDPAADTALTVVDTYHNEVDPATP